MDLTDLDLKRFARQLSLPGFGRETQLKLKNSTALITRCGGLGGPIALYLAAAGIGKLIIAHAGTLTWDDMNRMILQPADAVGQPRIDGIVESIRRFSPAVEVEAVGEHLDNVSKARPLVARADVVCDATPNFQERYALSEAAVLEGKPMIEAAMNAMEGHLTVLHPPQTPCLRCLYPAPPPSWDVYGFPVLGAVSGSLGCLAAIEAIKVLTGFGRPLLGRMLIYDTEVNLYQQVELTRNPNCPVCGKL
ncbi:MAG: HesA/MoeB/ThiF family protein [Phycisphaerae bacterium]|nr:HesA/MoeB/ThiF family protein [Phycisphaerae bacterium]